jgi:hypothetical protein
MVGEESVYYTTEEDCHARAPHLVLARGQPHGVAVRAVDLRTAGQFSSVL